MKNRVLIYLLVSILVVIFQNAYALPWPIPPQDSAHKVNKIYGDFNVIFYHNAIDIPGAIGTPVLAIQSGIVKNTGSGDTTGQYNFVAIARTMNEVLLMPKGIFSGIYFIQIEREGYKEVRKVVLIRG